MPNKLARNLLLFLTFFGLVTYIVAIEPRNWLNIPKFWRDALNLPALIIIAAAGWWALKRHTQAWLRFVWIFAYGFELIMLALFGFIAVFFHSLAGAGLRNFVSGLRHWLISPLPMAILLYLGSRKQNAGGSKIL